MNGVTVVNMVLKWYIVGNRCQIEKKYIAQIVERNCVQMCYVHFINSSLSSS